MTDANSASGPARTVVADSTAGLTERQRRVLEVIRDSVAERGYPPSIREIGDAVGLNSTSSVAHQLRTLERKGFLRRDANRPRAVDVRGLEDSAVTPDDSTPDSVPSTTPDSTPSTTPNSTPDSVPDPLAPIPPFTRIYTLVGGRATVTWDGAVLSLDALVFHHDLLIQREVVLDVQLCLLATKGAQLSDVRVVHSISVATAQCTTFIRDRLPGVELRAANSTAEAAKIAGEAGSAAEAAIGPEVAGGLYGLTVLVPRLLGPNDGAISYGQAAVAAARLGTHEDSLKERG